jgi:tetratricopeptide (TPR) repeat protein
MKAMTVTAQAPRISDQTLGRLLKWGSALFVILLVAFAVFYTLSQRVSTGPSVLERQISAAEAAVQESPKNLTARLALAQAYRASGRTDDSIGQYSEVLRVDKANMDALLGRGQTSLEAGKLDEAAVDFNAIIKASAGAEFARVDQRVGAAHYFLGSVQMRKGNPGAAAAEAQAALVVNETDSDALYLLGSALAAENKHADAVGVYLRALMFVPSGWCEPYESLQASWTKLSKPALSSYAQGMAQFCRGDHAAATATLKALTAGPAAADSMAGLGLISEMASDDTAAIDWYRKSLAKDPKNMNAMAGLSRLGVQPDSKSSTTTTK